jgi:hypothetical protein
VRKSLVFVVAFLVPVLSFAQVASPSLSGLVPDMSTVSAMMILVCQAVIVVLVAYRGIQFVYAALKGE